MKYKIEDYIILVYNFILITISSIAIITLWNSYSHVIPVVLSTIGFSIFILLGIYSIVVWLVNFIKIFKNKNNKEE